MKQTLVRLVVAVVIFVSAAAVTGAAEARALTERQAAAREIARTYTGQFYLGQLTALHAKFTPEMQDTMDLEAFREFRKQLDLQLGSEAEIYGEDVQESEDYMMYIRRVRFEKFKGVVEVRWILNDEYGIAGVFVSSNEKPTEQP